jgi:hypothetical protein
VAIDQMPVPTSATINKPIINLLLMENEMILLIIEKVLIQFKTYDANRCNAFI